VQYCHTCGNGTLRESSLIKSRALRIATGSYVFRVVLTVILPSTKSSTHAIPYHKNSPVCYHFIEGLGYQRPIFTEILFTILGKESCKGRFFSKGICIVFFGERVDFPLSRKVNKRNGRLKGVQCWMGRGAYVVYVVGVPWFWLSVAFVFVYGLGGRVFGWLDFGVCHDGRFCSASRFYKSLIGSVANDIFKLFRRNSSV
jgi:hypothetical protein